MTSNTKNKILGIIFILFSLFLLYNNLKIDKDIELREIENYDIQEKQETEKNEKEVKEKYIKEELDFIYDGKEEKSVYEFMIDLKNQRKVNFEEKDYIGMGKFIDEINWIKNDKKSWIYYVNNKKAEIGISKYKLKQGDKLIWRYEDFIN